jgi:pentatricopeptide repeat protein
VLQAFSSNNIYGVKPDGVAFVGVISACSCAGLVDEGLQYFLSMWRVHSISLSDEHFGYIFDLLGHTGHIYETEDFVSKLPQSRSSATCGVELYVFRLHGNVKLANMEHKSVLS